MTSEGCDWLIEMLIQDQQSMLIQDHILLVKITVTFVQPPQIVFNLTLETVACVLLMVYWAPLYHLLGWKARPQVELRV